jgi:type I site-specific restriction endonuclease
MPINEADTCRTFVPPKLYSAGWEDGQISDQKMFTDGRIVLVGNRAIRRKQKRADYLLRYRRDFPIAVVEAKAAYPTAGDGLQQAKEYAQILGLKIRLRDERPWQRQPMSCSRQFGSSTMTASRVWQADDAAIT